MEQADQNSRDCSFFRNTDVLSHPILLRFAVPLESFGIILGDPLPILIHETDSDHGESVPHRSLAIPLQRSIIVLGPVEAIPDQENRL